MKVKDLIIMILENKIPYSEFPLKLSLSWQLDTLYDLIQAGLVEKVNGDE